MSVGADWQGISANRDSKDDFIQASFDKGLKEALLERDGPFGDYSAKPK